MTDGNLSNGRMIGRILWQDHRQVAQTPTREIEVALFNGRVIYADGGTGNYAGVEIIELSDATSPFSGHRIVTLADGSHSNQSFAGETTFQEGSGRAGGTGHWAFVDGTGRFAGLQGGGSFRWELNGADYSEEFSG